MSIALSYTKYMSVILSFFGKNSLIILCTHLYCWKLLQPFHFSGFLQFGIVTVSMIPIIIIYIVGQKHITSGLTAGAVK